MKKVHKYGIIYIGVPNGGTKVERKAVMKSMMNEEAMWKEYYADLRREDGTLFLALFLFFISTFFLACAFEDSPSWINVASLMSVAATILAFVIHARMHIQSMRKWERLDWYELY